MFPGIFPFLQCVIGLCWYMLNVCKVSKGVFLPLFFWMYIHSLLLSKHLVDSVDFHLHHYVIHAKCLTKGEFGMFLNKEWTATKQLARCFSYSKQWPKALGETGLLCPRCIWCPIHSRKPPGPTERHLPALFALEGVPTSIFSIAVQKPLEASTIAGAMTRSSR